MIRTEYTLQCIIGSWLYECMCSCVYIVLVIHNRENKTFCKQTQFFNNANEIKWFSTHFIPTTAQHIRSFASLLLYSVWKRRCYNKRRMLHCTIATMVGSKECSIHTFGKEHRKSVLNFDKTASQLDEIQCCYLLHSTLLELDGAQTEQW